MTSHIYVRWANDKDPDTSFDALSVNYSGDYIYFQTVCNDNGKHVKVLNLRHTKSVDIHEVSEN
jgi:hypothetical protein